MRFRRLSHAFTVRCEDPAIAAYVAAILQRFAREDDGVSGVTYEVLDLGPSERENRYRLLIEGRWVLGSSNPAHILNDLFAHVNLDTVDAEDDLILIHAGAVATPAGAGVLLPAASGSGKTTLVAGLVRAGFGYLSDEAAVLEPTAGTVRASPTHLSLKAGSWTLFPDVGPGTAIAKLCGDTWHVDPDAIRAGSIATACEVGFVIPHRFQPKSETHLESLTPAAACVELGRNLMAPRRDAPRALGLIGTICAAARCYRLTWGDLGEAVDVIRELSVR